MQPYRILRGLQFLPLALWRVRTAGPLCLGIRPAGGRGESRPPGVTTRGAASWPGPLAAAPSFAEAVGWPGHRMISRAASPASDQESGASLRFVSLLGVSSGAALLSPRR